MQRDARRQGVHRSGEGEPAGPSPRRRTGPTPNSWDAETRTNREGAGDPGGRFRRTDTHAHPVENHLRRSCRHRPVRRRGAVFDRHCRARRPLGTTATVIGDDEVSTSATRAFWIENRTSEGMTVYGLKGAGDVLLPEDSLPEQVHRARADPPSRGDQRILLQRRPPGRGQLDRRQAAVDRSAGGPRVLSPGQVGRAMTEPVRSRIPAALTPFPPSPTTWERDWC